MPFTRLFTASTIARLSTLPFSVESYPAVPPKPMISLFERVYSPAPLTEYTTSAVFVSTTFKFTFE